MIKLLLVGAGQLGSRYLQGLKLINQDVTIEVVEPNLNAQKVAYERYEQIKGNDHVVNLSFFKNLSEASEQIDIAIIATNADHRFNIVTELLKTKTLRFLILEKVLFQKLEEYNLSSELIKTKNIDCWVNHTRREFPFYKKLKNVLSEEKQISFSVQGGDWGLACNGLHFIDLVSYLANSDRLTLNKEYLNDKIYPSKRMGYIEVQGTLIGKLGAHSFSLYSNESPGVHLITIASDNYRYIIDETKGIIRRASAGNQWNWEEWQEKIVYFQSELTHTIVEDILTKGHCQLPTYAEAMALHKPFIAALLEFYNKLTNGKHDRLPIT